VLTGVIAALIGQGMDPFDAAVLGAHVHGLAGDLAAREKGEISLAASDLLATLPAAFRRVR
jgi:NAD(P)H-hydrate epimerase